MTAVARRLLVLDGDPNDRETFGIRLSNPVGVQRAARAGRGLRGIEERAAVLGGTATAGPHDGRWVLSVTLPVRDARP